MLPSVGRKDAFTCLQNDAVSIAPTNNTQIDDKRSLFKY